MQRHAWRTWGGCLAVLALALVAARPVWAQEPAEPAQTPTESGPVGDYWIGLQCHPVPPPVQAQLKLSQDEGLFVASVVPDSPAMQAGVKEYDVLLKANDKPLGTVQDLVEAVQAAKDQPLKLDLVRGGEKMTFEVKPTKRPEQPPAGPGAPGSEWEQMRRWIERARPGEEGRPPLRFRFFHPGTILPPGATAEALPENMSVTILKEGKQPAKITVTRGDDKWEIGENELDKLPADVRPHVERMLGRGPHEPDALQFFDFVPGASPATPAITPESPQAPGRVEKRLESLERRLDQIRKSLDEMRENRPRLRDRQEQAPPASPDANPAPEAKQEMM